MPETPETPESPEPPKTKSPKPKPPKAESVKPEPFAAEGTGPATPASVPNRWAPGDGTPAPVAGVPGSPYVPPKPKRTSEQIRADIESQREQLGQNVDHLRDKVTELTDWRGQLMKHRKKIVVGAVATGFVVGGLMALRRR